MYILSFKPMPQRKLSPDSDTSDGIYEKIDGPPSPCSSTESTTGVEAPLITSKWNILSLKVGISRTFSHCLFLTHYLIILHFDALKIYSMENIVRKGEIACNKQFLLFSKFSTLYGAYFSF